MAITNRYSYGVTKRSAWEVNQAWREKRRQMIESFQNNNSAASAELGNAIANQMSGMATLTAEMANKRVQKEVLTRKIQAMNLAKA
jgi:hypothetical protein